MIKYFSVALLCSGMLFAAEKKTDITERRVSAFNLLTNGKLDSLHRFLTMIKHWQPDECDKDKLPWQQTRAIGDEKDVQVLFALSHPKTGHIEQWPSDKQEWVFDQFKIVADEKEHFVQDVLKLSTDPATRGKVVGRHIAMHGILRDRGIYTISAKPDSKRISWHYTNGIGI